jgi:tetratricopeptide (TPR) repeat protein
VDTTGKFGFVWKFSIWFKLIFIVRNIQNLDFQTTDLKLSTKTIPVSRLEVNKVIILVFTNNMDHQRQMMSKDQLMMNPFQNGGNLQQTPNREPKKYTELNVKSMDFNNSNFGKKPEIPLYKRSNSVDEINQQFPSSNSAFESKNMMPEIQKWGLLQTEVKNVEDKLTQLLNDPNINLEEFPLPPIPRDYMNSTQLFIPAKIDELIQQYTFDAEDLVIKGDHEKAKQLYLKVVRMNPYEATTWKALGHIFLQQNKLLECFNCFQGCLFHSEDNNDPALWFSIGELYKKLEMFEYWVTAFTTILQMNPSDEYKFKAHWKLGIVYCRLYELEKASDHLQKALLLNLAKKENNVEILIKLGLIEEEKGDLNKAISKYEYALKLNCETKKIHSYIAWAHFKANNYTMWRKHVSIIDEGTTIFYGPEWAISFYIKARIHENNNMFDEVYKLLWKILEIEPQNAAYWWSLSVVSYKMNEVEKAIKYAEKAFELNKLLPEARHNLNLLKSLPKGYDASMNLKPLDLKHPKNVLQNSLVITEWDREKNIDELNSKFNVINPKRTPESHSKPFHHNVRFKGPLNCMSMPSWTSDDNSKHENKPTLNEVSSGLNILEALREAEKKKSKPKLTI